MERPGNAVGSVAEGATTEWEAAPPETHAPAAKGAMVATVDPVAAARAETHLAWLTWE